MKRNYIYHFKWARQIVIVFSFYVVRNLFAYSRILINALSNILYIFGGSKMLKCGFKLKTTAIALALMAGSAANAAPVVMGNWGDHDPAEMGFFALITSGATPIDHIYTFSVATAVNGLWSSVSNDAPPVFDITGGLVQLWSSDGDADYGGSDPGDSLVTSLAFDSSSVNQTFTINPGDYYYQVTGSIDGLLGGSYLLSSSVTPVPEPEMYAMLLAGFGLIGFSLRRRAV